MLPWVCSVIDHRRRQNVVRTSVTHSAIASCATFLFLPHFDVSCDLLLNRRTATWNLFVKYKAKAMASCHFVMSLPFRSRFEAWFSGLSLNLSNFSQLFIPDHVWSEGDLYKSSPTHRLLDMSPYLQNLDVKQSLRQRLNILLICLTRVAACVTSQLGWSKIFRQLNDIPMIQSKQSRLSAGSNLV